MAVKALRLERQQRVDEAGEHQPVRGRRVDLPLAVTRALGSLGLAVLLVFILGPLLWVVLVAFAGRWTYPSLFPTNWTLSWWRDVFSVPGLVHSVELSFTFAPIVTLVSAVICLPAAYAFARLRFPGRRTLLVSLFATNAFPKIGLYITIAGLFYTLHLMGTFVGVVVVQLIGTIVFMTWIPSAAFAAVPPQLEEAARDVGARPLQVFLRVTLPIASPGIIVAVILSFLAAFDESQGTFLVGVPNYLTMPIRMYSMVTSYPPQASAVFAIVLSVPSVVLMLVARRWILDGALAKGFQLR